MSHGPCGCGNRMGSRLYDKKQQSRPYGGSLGAAGSDGRGRTGSASVASGCAL